MISEGKQGKSQENPGGIFQATEWGGRSHIEHGSLADLSRYLSKKLLQQLEFMGQVPENCTQMKLQKFAREPLVKY